MLTEIPTTHEPAEPGDTRFELYELEDEEHPVLVLSVDDQGNVYERNVFATRSEAFDMIEAFRYCQAVPFEEEFAPFGPAWEREQLER
jgi:hypothetical protein